MNKKNYFIFHALLAVAILLALAPDSMAQQYSLGVRAGGDMTWPGFADKEDRKQFGRELKPGFHAGLLVGFPLKKNYDVMLEGGYARRGRILTFNEDTWRNELTMQMADMAMLLRKSFRFMLKKNTPAKVFVNLGPEINYWFKSQGYIQVGKDGRPYNYEVILDKDAPADGGRYMVLRNTNEWLFSFALGVGLKAPLRNKQFISTELRFTSGHTFMGKKDSAFMDGIIWGNGAMQDTFATNLKTLSFSIAYTLDIDVRESRKGKSTRDPKRNNKR